MYSLEKGELVQSFYGHSAAVNKVSFAPNGKICSVSDDQSLRVWTIGKEQKELQLKSDATTKFHTAEIFDLQFVGSASQVVSLGFDDVFCISSLDSARVFYKSPL